MRSNSLLGLTELTVEQAMSHIIDYRGKTPKKTSCGIPLVTAKIVKNGRLEKYNEFIAEKDYASWMVRGIPKKGDIVLTVEAPLGEVAQLDETKIALAQRIVTLRGKENILDNTYLLYILQSAPMQSQLQSRASGTTVIGIKQSELRKIVLQLPPVSIQKKIAHILSTLDDKIELNRKMNQTLEEMAQALFRSWFVDFDPVHAKAGCSSDEELERAAKELGISKEVLELFPSEFDESELGMIPEGWTVDALKDFGTVITGKTPSTQKAENFGSEYPFITIPDMHGKAYITRTDRYLSSEGNLAQPNKLIPKNSLIVSCIATVGLVSINSEDSHTNQQINSILCEEVFLYYLYCMLSSMTDTLVMYGGAGTATLNVNKTTFENIKITKPSIGTLEAFMRLIKPSFKQILANTQQIQTLQQTRDILLPKLLSGELDVSELELDV